MSVGNRHIQSEVELVEFVESDDNRSNKSKFEFVASHDQRSLESGDKIEPEGKRTKKYSVNRSKNVLTERKMSVHNRK